MFKIVDNFLDENYFNELKKVILGDSFPWYYNDVITNAKDSQDKLYFTHSFYNDLDSPHDPGVGSRYFYILKPFLNHIKCKSIIRIKANLHLNKNKKQIHQSHVDYSFSHKGCLLYLNDNNGFTYFEKESVEPKANRVVFFNPSKKHSSSLCTDKKRRVNINFNYF